MLRYVVPALVAVVPLLGCSRAMPSAKEGPAAEKLQPRLESVAYLPAEPKIHGFLCRPGGKGPYPAVVMIHDRLGLTDGIKDQTYHLAGAGYVVLAVDLYRGERPKSEAEAERLERQLPTKRAVADIKAALDYLLERPDVRKMRTPLLARDDEDRQLGERKSWDIGAIGLGMGGTYALEAALEDQRLRALVLCYCLLPTDAKRLEPLNASVFCIVAGKDKRVTTEMIQKFGEAMRDARKRVSPLRVYRDCQYGFLDPSSWPTHGKPKSSDVEEAWKLIAEYLSDELK
jgi:carboxymethylenebutenolidase